MMFNKFIILSTLLSIFSYAQEIKPAGTLVIDWDKTQKYVFDVGALVDKCTTQKYSQITWDKTIPDYYDIIQKELDDNNVVYLTAGTYVVSKQLSLKSNNCLVGEDMSKTIIKLVDNAAPFDLSGLLRSKNTLNLVVSSITLDGNRDNQLNDIVSAYGRYGFFSEVCNNVFLNKVSTINNQGYGFDPHGNKVDWATNLVIVGSVSSGNGFDGFALDQTNNISFIGNTAIKNDRHGVNVITGSNNVNIYNNVINFNGAVSTVGCGITIQNNDNLGTKNVLISTNELTDNFNDNVCVRNVSDITIDKNKMYKNTDSTNYCIAIEVSTNVLISNNYCFAYNFVLNKLGINVVIEKNNVFEQNTKPIITGKPDPYCDTGIIDTNICCDGKCTVCGGPTCSKDPLGSDNCCSTIIASSFAYCNTTAPPCIIVDEKPPPTPPKVPDPTCTTGIINKNVCCKKECTTCGGLSCSVDALGSNNCCTSTIIRNGYFCDTFSPPCIIGTVPTLLPTDILTTTPTITPTVVPTTVPSVKPTTVPTIKPTKPVNSTVVPTPRPTDTVSGSDMVSIGKITTVLSVIYALYVLI